MFELGYVIMSNKFFHRGMAQRLCVVYYLWQHGKPLFINLYKYAWQLTTHGSLCKSFIGQINTQQTGGEKWLNTFPGGATASVRPTYNDAMRKGKANYRQ